MSFFVFYGIEFQIHAKAAFISLVHNQFENILCLVATYL